MQVIWGAWFDDGSGTDLNPLSPHIAGQVVLKPSASLPTCFSFPFGGREPSHISLGRWFGLGARVPIPTLKQLATPAP